MPDACVGCLRDARLLSTLVLAEQRYRRRSGLLFHDRDEPSDAKTCARSAVRPTGSARCRSCTVRCGRPRGCGRSLGAPVRWRASTAPSRSPRGRHAGWLTPLRSRPVSTTQVASPNARTSTTGMSSGAKPVTTAPSPHNRCRRPGRHRAVVTMPRTASTTPAPCTTEIRSRSTTSARPIVTTESADATGVMRMASPTVSP